MRAGRIVGAAGGWGLVLLVTQLGFGEVLPAESGSAAAGCQAALTRADALVAVTRASRQYHVMQLEETIAALQAQLAQRAAGAPSPVIPPAIRPGRVTP